MQAGKHVEKFRRKKKKGSNLVWEDLEKEEEWTWDKVV